MSKVLLVEDSVLEFETLKRYLQKQGFLVYGVRSAEEAHLRLKQQKPDVILLDVILPGASGFELCRKLKKDSKTKAIPVVICSTKNTKVDRIWSDMSGADAYITKPVDEATLIQTINQFVN
ncbi:MAG: response regulator [Prochloraceae cyanobacterium]|nr:response regulator [Prochloraceae cyanobacterium]